MVKRGATYWLDLFTPETWEEANKAGFKISGFREGRKTAATKIKPGDYFICYITRISRFSGILKVKSKLFYDPKKAKEIWPHDSFPVLFKVEPGITFDFLHSLPKKEVISKLSDPKKWGGLIRGSPTRINEPDGKEIIQILKKSQKEKKEYPLKIKNPLKTRKRKTPEYGIPMDFRGLRHTPVNEQGVVYLFALVAQDLGFTVEAIGTQFPDCEAERKSKKGNRWQKVRVEFEKSSSDFKLHRHNAEDCDIIVCWKHDWKNCPLEVIELSTVIKDLGARFYDNKN